MLRAFSGFLHFHIFHTWKWNRYTCTNFHGSLRQLHFIKKQYINYNFYNEINIKYSQPLKNKKKKNYFFVKKFLSQLSISFCNYCPLSQINYLQRRTWKKQRSTSWIKNIDVQKLKAFSRSFFLYRPVYLNRSVLSENSEKERRKKKERKRNATVRGVSSSVRDQGKVKETTCASANSYVEHITEPWTNKKNRGEKGTVYVLNSGEFPCVGTFAAKRHSRHFLPSRVYFLPAEFNSSAFHLAGSFALIYPGLVIVALGE